MKKAKILVAAALMLAVTTTVSAAKKKEPLKISIFTIQQKQQPPADNKMYKWIKDTFNVEFTWDILVGDKDQKIGLLIASGDLPDMVHVDSPRFYDAGVLRPLDDKEIQKKYKNIWAHYKDSWELMREPDGKVYTLPDAGVYDGPDQGTYYNGNAFWIQKEVLKEFGYPKISTIDEYFDILEKYAAKYPTIEGMPTIPFSIITAGWEDFNLRNPPVFLSGSPNEGDYTVVSDGKGGYKLNFAAPGPDGKKWYKIANEKYNKGVYDPASFTDNRDQYYAKLSSGRVLGMFIQGWEFMGDVENTLRTNGMSNRTFAPLPIVFDKSIKPHYRERTVINLQRGYSITTKCDKKKAEQILQFIDDQLKVENQIILQWGFEGEDWQKDAKGQPYRTEKQRADQQDNNWILHNKAELWTSEAPKMQGSWPSGEFKGLSCSMGDLPWEFQANATKEDKELWAAYGVNSYAALMDKNPPANEIWYPMWQVKEPEDGTAERAIYDKYLDVFAKHLPGIIMCKPAEFETKWSAFQKDLDNLGMAKYEKWFQQQLDKRIKERSGTGKKKK